MRWFVVVCAITTVVGTTSPSLHAQWRQWKESHGKIYADEASESARRATWEENSALVARHNGESHKHGFKLALNQFADQVRCTSDHKLNINSSFWTSRQLL